MIFQILWLMPQRRLQKLELICLIFTLQQGDEAMRVVMERLRGFKNRPLVLAVTALTHLIMTLLRRFMG